jgi:hypothetical protein
VRIILLVYLIIGGSPVLISLRFVYALAFTHPSSLMNDLFSCIHY